MNKLSHSIHNLDTSLVYSKASHPMDLLEAIVIIKNPIEVNYLPSRETNILQSQSYKALCHT